MKAAGEGTDPLWMLLLKTSFPSSWTTAPEELTVSIEPEYPTAKDELLCVYTVDAEVDGESLTAVYSWSVSVGLMTEGDEAII